MRRRLLAQAHVGYNANDSDRRMAHTARHRERLDGIPTSRIPDLVALEYGTQEIVTLLRTLALGRPLSLRSLAIIEAGTEMEFKPEDNANWDAVTRPIVEAFLRARFFLEMAVRYSQLDQPPDPLPSGYAALLCLYGLR